MDDREKEVKKRKQPSGDSRAVPPAPVVKPRKRIIRRTRSRIAKQMGLADAPMMPIATLTDAEPILVASVAQKLPITDKTAIPFARGTKHTITNKAAIPVTRGTKLTNTDEAAIPVAGGQQLPFTPRIGLLSVLNHVKCVRVDPYLDGLVTVHQVNNYFL